MAKVAYIFVIALFGFGCDGEVKVNEQKLDTAGAKLQRTVKEEVDSIGAKLDRPDDKTRQGRHIEKITIAVERYVNRCGRKDGSTWVLSSRDENIQSKVAELVIDHPCNYA